MRVSRAREAFGFVVADVDGSSRGHVIPFAAAFECECNAWETAINARKVVFFLSTFCPPPPPHIDTTLLLVG